MLNWLYTWLGLSNASGPIYLAWSGFVAAVTGFGFVGGIAIHIKQKNCHVKGCPSIFTAPDPMHGWPACRKHHSMGDQVGIIPDA